MNFYSRRILLVLALVMPLANVNAGTETSSTKKKENAVVQFFKDHGVKIAAGLGVLVAAVFCYKFFIKKEEGSEQQPVPQKEKTLKEKFEEQLSPQEREQYLECRKTKRPVSQFPKLRDALRRFRAVEVLKGMGKCWQQSEQQLAQRCSQQFYSNFDHFFGDIDIPYFEEFHKLNFSNIVNSFNLKK